MTWEEFKKHLEEKGVKDDDEIWYIDVSFPIKRDIVVERDELELGIKVYN